MTRVSAPHIIQRLATPPRGSKEAEVPNDFSMARNRADTEGVEQLLSLSVGERVEQYEIIRELGRGGMGQVFLARDTRLGRLVAIKFLTRTSEAFVKRFVVEAQTTARCTHENIVVIYETNTFLGHPYMVLEYLEGLSLARILADRSLSPVRTVEIMVPVVRALTRAHQFGIVHRDLKPENVVITHDGAVKVLDFGVAKLFGDNDEPLSEASMSRPDTDIYETLSTGNRLVGTLPFMSPEQFGMDVVDERTDLWAAGVILYRMLSGMHPINDVSTASLMFSARELDQPHRSLAIASPTAPERLVRIVDRCLRKRKAERYASAAELLADLEALLPARHGRRLGEDECPYPGLVAFGEDDADRFFGRTAEIARATALMRDHAVLALVGPSGTGKSSFVRAGLIPALKSSGASWETFVLRPGRNPLATFPSLIEACTGRAPIDDYAAILRDEPGYLGHILRQRARDTNQRILLVIDQFEELFTIAPEADRETYLSVLQGIADDSTSPLRLVLSLRSDFLHRMTAHAQFATAVMRGMLLFGPPDRQALRDAIVSPAEQAGFQFESDEMVDEVVDDLSTSAASYPLLQFCLSTLWSQRDRMRHLITHASFRKIGGVAGALATHADQIIASLAQSGQHVARALFQRLVTSEGTRAIVDATELSVCSPDRDELHSVLATLVDARLLIHHQDTDTVEIIHEALVAQWPTLRRWIEESRDDTVFLEQVRVAARQWESKGRSGQLLWRGPAAAEAARFIDRHGDGTLAERDREFLREGIAAGRRAGRRKTIIVGTVIVVLALAVAGSTIALFAVRQAQARAETETARARDAERTVREQLEVVRLAERDRATAAAAADAAAADAAKRREEAEMSREEADMSREQLATAFEELKGALRRAEIARDRAEASRRSEEDAKRKLEQALDREKERTKKLQEQRGKIVDQL